MIYPERESRTLEFKEKLPKFDHLIRTCVAFANGAGGKLIIGIEDQTRKIIGISDKDRDRIYDEFTNSLYDAVSPNLFAQIYEQNISNILILIIEIPPSPRKPYFIKRDKIPKGVWVRVGSNTRQANEEIIEELIREGNRVTFDEELIQKNDEILKPNLLKAFYHGQAPTKTRLLNDKIIGLLSNHAKIYRPTVAGTLMFSTTPHLYIPEAIIICTRFSGKQARHILQTEEITGPISHQADVALQFLYGWLKRNYTMKHAKLTGETLVPKVALREAVINALIHRKYSIHGAIKIALYEEDRLEIFSPGCFPGLIDIENLGDGTTFLRNPNLARLARQEGLVEKLGSGIRLIFESCKKAGLKKPVYSEDGDFVKVTFYFQPEVSLYEDDIKAILALSKTKDIIVIQDVMNLLNVSRNTATRKLNKLIEQKRIIRLGKGPNIRYQFFNKNEE